MYMLIAIDYTGHMRVAMTDNWIVPDDFLKPGEIAFTVAALDIRGRHVHEVPQHE